MTRRARKLQAADLFCGAGGTTTGAERAGMRVVLAVNHWRTAILSHQHNHPHTRHICARIEHIDARNDSTLPKVDVILASPECTYHSNARGGRPIKDQHRQQPFALLDWLDAQRPSDLVVENVREFRDWGPCINVGTAAKPNWRPDPKRKGETFKAWVQAIESLGYQVDWNLLNAADFGAPTKRIRLFVHAVRADILKRRGGTIVWPAPTHAGAWRPAWEVIDWSIPCPSIFGRKRPLAPKTLARIEAGLRKFVGPFVTQYHNGPDGSQRNYDLSQPVPTLDTQNRYGLVMPFALTLRRNMDGRALAEPVSTITAGAEHHGVVVPYLFDVNHGEDAKTGTRCYSTANPLGTLTSKQGVGVAVPFTVMLSQSGSNGQRVNGLIDPMGTITTAKGGERAICIPWLTKYYGTGSVQPTGEPVDTVTTKDRFGLAMASLGETMRELRVVDIGFRMLAVEELLRAQGFPEGYMLFGAKHERIRQVGNAVCPPVAEALCRTIQEAAAA